jgi:hypothetical protein
MLDSTQPSYHEYRLQYLIRCYDAWYSCTITSQSPITQNQVRLQFSLSLFSTDRNRKFVLCGLFGLGVFVVSSLPFMTLSQLINARYSVPVSASTTHSPNHSRPCGHSGMSERPAPRSSLPTFQIAGPSCDVSSTCGLSSARDHTRLLALMEMHLVRCVSKVRQYD